MDALSRRRPPCWEARCRRELEAQPVISQAEHAELIKPEITLKKQSEIRNEREILH
jgi:hypothetical protein